MTKEDFLTWAKQYRNTSDIRRLVERMAFTGQELEQIKRGMEPSVKLKAEYARMAVH